MSSVRPVPVVRAADGGRLTAGPAWRAARTLGTVALLRECGLRFRYGDGFSHARALGLQLALAAIPLVIAVVGLSNELSTGVVGQLLRRTLLSLTPGASDELLREAMRPLSAGGDESGAELALWLGLTVALLALTTAMGQLERGANRIYGIQRDRPSLVKYGRALVLALTAGLPAMAAVLVLMAAPTFSDTIEDLYGVDDDVVAALAWPAGAVTLLGALLLMLRHAPHREQPAWSLLAVGGGTALLGGLALTALLAAYLRLSAGLGAVYGPLTGVLALLVWAQLTSAAVFLGLAVTASLEATALEATALEATALEGTAAGPGPADREGAP